MEFRRISTLKFVSRTDYPTRVTDLRYRSYRNVLTIISGDINNEIEILE